MEEGAGVAGRRLVLPPEGDGQLPHVRFGPEDAPAAVVVPGLADGRAPLTEPDVAAMLAAPPPAFARARVDVVSFPRDLAADVRVEDLADRVAAHVEHLGRPVLLSGHSLGAMVAVTLAGRRPDLVGLLVLSCAPLCFDAAQRRILRSWDELVRAGEIRAFERAALEVAHRGIELARRRTVLDALPVEARPHLAPRHAALTHAALAFDGREVARDVRAPALVLGGALDPLARPAQVRALAAALPHGQPTIVRRAAHGLPEQAPATVARLVTTFAARHRARLGGQQAVA